jgi:integrase
MSRQRVAEGIYVYETRHGKHYLLVAGVKGQQVTQAAPEGVTLRQAKALRRQLIESVAGGKPEKPATLAQAGARWLKDGKVAGLAAASLQARQLALRALERIVGGDKPLRDLTVGDYESARDRLLEGTWTARRTSMYAGSSTSREVVVVKISAKSTTAPRRTAGALSPGTVTQYMSMWRALEMWASKRKLLTDRPCSLVSLPRVEPCAKALSLDALQAFLAACQEHEAPYGLLLPILALMPLRMSEFRGMQWGDIDFKAGYFHLSRAVAPTFRGKPGETVGVKTVADGKLHPRSVPIPSHCLPFFRAQREWQRSCGRPDIDPTGWVWSNERGVLLSYDRIRLVKDRYMREAGLESVRLHDFRHTGASRMLAEGVAIAHVQQMTGHKTTKLLLDVYNHADPLDTKREADRYGALVLGQRQAEKEAM